MLLDGFTVLKNLYPVFVYPGKLTVASDCEDMAAGKVRVLILRGLPLSGKSTIIHELCQFLSASKVKPVIVDIIGQTIHTVLATTDLNIVAQRDLVYARTNQRVSEELQKRTLQNDELLIVALPPLEFDTRKVPGKTAFESLVPLILENRDGWGACRIWVIAPLDLLALLVRANLRDWSYKLAGGVSEQINDAQFVSQIVKMWGSFEQYVAALKTSLPAERNIAVYENLAYYSLMSKLSAVYNMQGPSWSELRNNAAIPMHLVQALFDACESGDEKVISFILSCIFGYKTKAAGEQWKLNELGLSSDFAMVLGNPQIL